MLTERDRLSDQVGMHVILTAWELTVPEAHQSMLCVFLTKIALQTLYLGQFLSNSLKLKFIVLYTSERPNASIHATRHSRFLSLYEIYFNFAVYKPYFGRMLGVLGASCANEFTFHPITIVAIHSSRFCDITSDFAEAYFESVQSHLPSGIAHSDCKPWTWEWHIRIQRKISP